MSDEVVVVPEEVGKGYNEVQNVMKEAVTHSRLLQGRAPSAGRCWWLLLREPSTLLEEVSVDLGGAAAAVVSCGGVAAVAAISTWPPVSSSRGMCLCEAKKIIRP